MLNEISSNANADALVGEITTICKQQEAGSGETLPRDALRRFV
jgi:hypothetical protein